MSLKESTYKAGDPGLILGTGRSPGNGNGYPSSIPDWTVPWTEGPGGQQSMGLQKVGHGLMSKHQHTGSNSAMRTLNSISPRGYALG